MALFNLDVVLRRVFYKLGRVVGRHPGYFLIVPVLFSLFCLTGFQRIRFNDDFDYLFTPTVGPGRDSRAVAEEHFRVNYSGRFNADRLIRPGMFVKIIATSVDEDKNLLRVEVWKELQHLNNMVQNLTVVFDDDYFSYKDVCAKWGARCYKNDVLDLDHIMGHIEKREMNLTFPTMLNPRIFNSHIFNQNRYEAESYFFPEYFGGSVVSEDGFVTSVPSIRLKYFLSADNKKVSSKSTMWEKAFLDLMQYLKYENVFKHIKITYTTSQTLSKQWEEDGKTSFWTFSFSFIAMTIFSILNCIVFDWVHSKPWLAIFANFGSCLATASAFGTCIYLGLDFARINMLIPFLMFALGNANMFVALSSWERTSLKDSVSERMGKTFKDVAVPITIAFCTTLTCFVVGIFNTFPSVQIFSIYGSVATLYNLMWHFSFFSSCLALTGYCEESNRHALICIKVRTTSRSHHRSLFYKLFCAGGIDFADIDNPSFNRERFGTRFFKNHLSRILNNAFVKVFVLVVFSMYLLGAFYGVTQVREGLERNKYLGNDSHAYFQQNDRYFREFTYRIQVVVSGELDYSNSRVQNQIERLTQTFENTSFVAGSLYTKSWLRSFVQFAEQNPQYVNGSIKVQESFIYNLQKLWLYPSSLFSLDVKFNRENDAIEAMRFTVQAINITSPYREKEMLQILRQICRNTPLNVTIFYPDIRFIDETDVVKLLFIQNMIVGATVILILAFLVVPNPLCCLWITFGVFSIETGVVGYMSIWNVKLDPISMIVMIVCVALAANFTSNSCYAYTTCRSKRSTKKLQECLHATGLPIMQSQISLVFSLIVLLLFTNALLLTIFKMVLLATTFGTFHAIIFLPVTLSILCPDLCDTKNRPKKVRLPASTVGLPRPYCIPHPQFTYNGSGLRDNFLNSSPTQPKRNKVLNDSDKDQGLGTSEDNSSDVSSHRIEGMEVRLIKWDNRPNVRSNPNRASGRVLDIFGNDTEREWQRLRKQKNDELLKEIRQSKNFSKNSDSKNLTQSAQRYVR